MSNGSSNKETKELNAIPARFINGFYRSMEDGDFDFLTDYVNFLGTVTAIQPGISGASKIKEENIGMSIEDRNDLLDSLDREMPDVPPEDRYDIAHGLHGTLAWVRLAWRKGAQKGAEDLKEQIRNGEVSIEEILGTGDS
jgi:hypothetical protein